MLATAQHQRTVVSGVVAAGLVIGFAVAQLTGSRPAGGLVILLLGVVAAVLMWRAGSRWGIVVAGTAYALAFVLSHPLAGIITAWPAAILAGLAAGAVAYVLTPEDPR